MNLIKKEIKTEEEEVAAKSQGFICPQCEAHFLYDEYFMEHIREHHNNMISENSESSSLEVGNINSTPVTEKSLQCAVCSFTCSTRYTLLQHQKTHGKRPFRCDQCSYTCTYKSELVRHERVHTGEKPYK